jgi:hypothetical protein
MSNQIFNNDIEILSFNLNNQLNEYNNSLTLRKRKIDFKTFYYFLIQYNFISSSSYDSTNLTIFNNNETCDSSYQAFVKKRNNVDISVFNNINNKLISSLYKHIEIDKNNNYKYKINNTFYRLIACDGSQLNFLYSLHDNLKANKHNTYTYANLSCLFDVELQIPINYMMSKDDERTLLIKQLSSLDNNDILIADRGYYSNHLIQKLNEKKINFVLRISKHNKYYIDNVDKISKLSEGSIDIDIETDNLKLYWYKTNKDTDKDINNILKLIEKKKNRIDECKKQVEEDNLKYNNLHKENKDKLLNISESKLKNVNKNKIKSLNNELKKNREDKNELKIIIDKNNKEIKTLSKELHKLYDEKNSIERANKSVYYIITNLQTLSIDQVKEIYKKRWVVETHFLYAKELSKLNSMNNKNYEYIKQNIAITQFIFLTSGYIQYILKKKIKKNQIFNNTSLITSIKHKLIYYLLNCTKKCNKIKIIELLNKLIKSIIPKILTQKYKNRIKKRPQKNHYNTNTS